MIKKSWGSSLISAVLIASSVAACGQLSCDTAMRATTVAIDFSRLSSNREGLEFTISCPGQDSCVHAPETNNTRYNADTDNPVAVIAGTKSLQVTVYEKASTVQLAQTTADLNWDPPYEAGCSTAATASIKV